MTVTHTISIQRVFTLPQEIAKGLMDDYDPLLPSCGALFVFPEKKLSSFWMKNTPRALDIIFISNNQITCIYEGARPFDESYITCPVPVDRVIEVLAGYCKTYGLSIGDYVVLDMVI